jgi:uncharacterized protein (TIGR02147 family)
MKHGKAESDYFENLVCYSQARTIEEKNRYFERLKGFARSTMRLVDANQHEFYSKWYITAVRELLAFVKFKDDYNELACLVSPAIRPDEAKKAVRVLCNLGMVKKDGGWCWRPAEAFITTAAEVQSLNVANFHRAMLEKAGESIDRYPAAERDLSTLTVSAAAGDVEEIKEEIRAFKGRVCAIIAKGRPSEQVYHLNINFFPLSRRQQKAAGGLPLIERK